MFSHGGRVRFSHATAEEVRLLIARKVLFLPRYYKFFPGFSSFLPLSCFVCFDFSPVSGFFLTTRFIFFSLLFEGKSASRVFRKGEKCNFFGVR